MTDFKTLNAAISDGQSAIYARQLEETIRALKKDQMTTRQGLAEVARILCPDQVDFLTQKYPGSSAATLPLGELIVSMKGVAQTLRLIAANSNKSPGSKEEKLLARVTELEGLLRAEKRRADLFERSKALAEQTLESERSKAAKAAKRRGQPENSGNGRDLTASQEQREAKSIAGAVHTDTQALNGQKGWETWALGFESEELEETKAIIKNIVIFLGETGGTTIAEIARGLVLDTQVAESRVKYATERFKLLSEQESPLRASGGGRPEKIYSLSPKGVWYFKHITGQDPVLSKMESSIKSANHEGLVYKIAACFEALNWNPLIDPPRIYFDDNTYYEADILVTKDNQKIFVEVETGVHIKTETADNWDIQFTNAIRAGHGVICFATEARNQMTTMLGKINYWLAEKKMGQVCIYATNLRHLEEVHEGESPWEKVEHKSGQV